MGNVSKRILLAVDGSEQSMDVVRYVCSAVQHTRAEVVIYQVMSKVPEVFWDLGKDPAWAKKIESLREWEKQQETLAVRFMNTAFELFKTAGFSQAEVTTRIGRQKEGIARDIISEARQGYDVVVVGRGKSSQEEGAPLGGIASKILGAATTFSLWLIGGNPGTEKILIAMDSSKAGFKAVEHAGAMFNDGHSRMTLFHAIRGISVSAEGLEDIFPEAYRKQLMDDAQGEIHPALQEARNYLEKQDINPGRISTKITTSVKSRAMAIVQEAAQGGYGTIVVGRRGISEVAEFSMGRVTNKLTQLAKAQALCIVA